MTGITDDTSERSDAVAPPPLVEAIEVRRSFETPAGRIDVVRGVDLRVERGSTTAIVGPSGSGKSTLLHLLAGVERPTAGSVLLDGTDTAELGESQLTAWRRARCCLLLQRDGLIPTLTAAENAAVPLLLAGTRRREALGRAQEALGDVGVAHRAAQYPASLSGGELQRVAVARIVCSAPAVAFADEPTGALDSANEELVLRLLIDAVAAAGTALVIVTHSPRVAAAMEARIDLSDGRVVEGAAP